MGVFAFRGGASPVESSALLEFLVGGQDQRHFCFCCLGKLSAAQENGSGNASLPCVGYIFGLVCLSLGYSLAGLCLQTCSRAGCGGFSLAPYPYSPWVCVPALPCGGCSLCPSGAEQELIHRPSLNDPCSPVALAAPLGLY